MLVDFDERILSLEEAELWIMDLYFGQKWQFTVKMPYQWICFLQTCSFYASQALITQLKSCELLVDYCDVKQLTVLCNFFFLD